MLIKVRRMFLLLFIISLAIIGFRLIDSTFVLELFGAAVPVFLASYIIMIFVPVTVPGRWTHEGKEVYRKWKSFGNYIKDYSLISQRPPASVQVWGKYLVYAASLGCADKATENMKKFFESNGISYESFTDTGVASFAYYGGLAHMKSSFNVLSGSESSGFHGGIGHSGSGGFGGGGGGTF